MFHWGFRRVFDNIIWPHYGATYAKIKVRQMLKSENISPFPFQYFSCVCRICVELDWTKYENNCLPPLLINMWPKYLWKPSDESIVVDSPKLVVQLGPGRERPYLQNKLVGRPPRWKWFRGKRTFLSDLLSKLWKRMKVFLFLYGTLHSWCRYYWEGKHVLIFELDAKKTLMSYCQRVNEKHKFNTERTQWMICFCISLFSLLWTKRKMMIVSQIPRKILRAFLRKTWLGAILCFLGGAVYYWLQTPVICPKLEIRFRLLSAFILSNIRVVDKG